MKMEQVGVRAFGTQPQLNPGNHLSNQHMQARQVYRAVGMAVGHSAKVIAGGRGPLLRGWRGDRLWKPERAFTSLGEHRIRALGASKVKTHDRVLWILGYRWAHRGGSVRNHGRYFLALPMERTNLRCRLWLKALQPVK